MDTVIVLFFVAGFTQLVKSLFDRDYRSAVIIVGAAVIGGLVGFFHVVVGLDLANGIVAGLGASGLVTVAQATGGQKISNIQLTN